MRFVPVSAHDREQMLATVGIEHVDELFNVVPEAVRFQGTLDIPGDMSEIELSAHLEELAARNEHAGSLVSFLGAGSYDHYLPAVVDAMVSKPAFFTAYTPYQPEVSQGTLQAIYEFQSMMCELTGADIANASLYDGATAMVEGALMASRVTKRGAFVVSDCVHPEWRATLRTYAAAGGHGVAEVPRAACGGTDLTALAEAVGHDTAAVLVASPSFYGTIEDVRAIARIAHEAGALLVLGVNPVLLGVLEAPVALGADVVVGEGQPLGSPMSFGGPGFGFFACDKRFVRQMPGRIVGRTTDVDGRTGFVLTMATREQHIRREKATSNICSNQGLNALAAGVYLAAVGGTGLAGIAEACVAKAHYLHDQLIATGRFSRAFDAPFAHEFALRYDGDVALMQQRLLEAGFLAGLDLGTREIVDSGLVLFAVTEKRTRAQMDRFVKEVSAL